MDIKPVKTMLVSAMYIMVILALALSVTGYVQAQEPDPWLIAFPENDAVEGWEWPDEATVTLTIDNAPGLSWSGTAAVTTWGDPRTYVRIEFSGEYDLQIGDEVTLIDDYGTIRTHTVQNLLVTNVNGDTDTVSGTAFSGAIVQVWPHGFDQDYFIEDIAEDGTWTANFGDLGFHSIEETGGRSQILVGNNATAVDWNVVVPPPTPWRDEFSGSLDANWYWVNENQDKWDFNDDYLRIFASPYGTGGENLLLRPITADDFSIETRVFFEPDINFQIAGLVIWQDASNFISFGRAFCDIEGGCVGSGIYFDKIINGEFIDGNFATEFYNPFNTAENYLRIERRGNMVRALYSHEGITWTEIGFHWLPDDFQVNGVGIQAAQDFYTPEWDIPADFDYFETTEGWGFLPEGYHDYYSGDVPYWNCGVLGWATDPDDRLTDVAIEVGIDGTSLPYWLYASDYREDLDNADVCEDGNCSFSMSLWDVISSYEPHNIVTYAQDLQTGEWVQLRNSPKTLTCRTYDIYGYNPQTGTTQQLTNIRDGDEYNPSFSPNGKLVAHDVVNFDGSYGIYITDLTTGTSAPLSGAEAGGNDAAFSPNGKWILFDTAWTDTPNLYIVPDVGGTPTLVRENSVAGDWAPNGKRIVFQDMDGSLRTIAVNKVSETYLVPNGLEPAWSPDGNWIAYIDNGDIWKLPVNIHGMPQGEPIQLTSGMRWDGQPTWSMDSLTIIFHTGLGPDYDLWSVPATGGDPVWLTGAAEFGDYDPAGAKNSADVAYASFLPEGQAPRTWVAAFTYDLPAGYWTEGTHSYHFETMGADPTPEITFDVLGSELLYDGKVLMRSGALRGRTGEECLFINAINPAQQSQFHIGWTADGTYAEALSQLEALMLTVVWDGGAPMSLFQHEVFPFTSQVDWGGYVCSFTYP